METLMSIVVGLFFAIGIYLILTKDLLRVILGSSIISHGVNLAHFDNGWTKNRRGSPIR